MVIARISNLLGKITILVMVGLFINTAVALDGSGTQEDPWRIKSLDDFNDFAADANYWAGFTRLETDVNLAGEVYERAVIAGEVNDANMFFEGIAFTGVFDGNGHKIINLTIDGEDYLGLFGFIDHGEVRNLGVEGVSVSGEYLVGGLVGYNGGYVSNCYSTGDVNGVVEVGGLVGTNEGDVSNCYSSCDVYGEGYVGGLVGGNVYYNIIDCYASGTVTLLGLGFEYDIGGLVGWNYYGSISNCYSTADVNGGSGLVGFNLHVVSNCFWDTEIQTHGVTESIGDDYGIVTNVHGLPTSQLHQQSTFTDWDFINVWNIGENQTYPYLRVYLAADINKDGIVNFLDVAITANQWMEEQ